MGPCYAVLEENEMENSRCPCFFETFSANLFSARLKLPSGFLKHLEEETHGSLSLVGPSGNIWVVELVQQGGGLFLDHGWPTFVADHSLECGDLLVFRYDGKFCFTVQVFDASKCEKEAAFQADCSRYRNSLHESTGKKRAREEDYAVSDKISKRRKNNCSGENSECTERNESMEALAGMSDLVDILPKCGLVILGKASQKRNLADQTEQSWSRSSNAASSSKFKSLHENPGYGSAFSEREKRVAESFISCYPYFVRIMKRFNINGSYTLNIPYKFSMAHLPACKTEIVLGTVKGATFTVNSVPTTKVHTSHTLCGGWMAFVRSNDLKIGDVCIFELVRKYELRVFILRAGKDGPDNQSEILACNGVKVGCSATSQRIQSHRKKSRKPSSKVGTKLIKHVELCEVGDSNKSQPAVLLDGSTKHSPATKISDSNFKTLGKGEYVEGDLHTKTGMGVKMMLSLEEKAAKSFRSRFPHFVRIMRKFNVSGSYTLKIPHRFSTEYLPGFKTEIVLCNLRGGRWPVNSLPDSKGRSVHTFCGGWMAFVRDNGVKLGNTCIFELVSSSEMRVHIHSNDGGEGSENQSGNSAGNNEMPLVPFSSDDHHAILDEPFS